MHALSYSTKICANPLDNICLSWFEKCHLHRIDLLNLESFSIVHIILMGESIDCEDLCWTADCRGYEHEYDTNGYMDSTNSKKLGNIYVIYMTIKKHFASFNVIYL